MDLNANESGKALLQIGGSDLLNECNKIGRLVEGEMHSTGSGDLNCQRVYHVNLPGWKNGGAQVRVFIYVACKAICT